MYNREPWKLSCYDSECESVPSIYPCPVYNCSKHGNEDINWVHGGGCRGDLRLYSNGKEKCQKCGEEEYFCLWECSCYDASKNENQYSYHKIKNIIGKLAGMDTYDVSPTFLIYVKMSIDQQVRDHPEKFADIKRK